MIELRGYLDELGRNPFSEWLQSLDSVTAARVTTTLLRLETGNSSNLKAVGSGVLELKLSFGPGYRVYLGRDGDELIILLGGGSKQRQSKDIALAQQRWADYKRRKKQEMT